MEMQNISLSHKENNSISLGWCMKALEMGWSMKTDKKQFHNLYNDYYPGFIFSARNVGPWGEMQIKYWMSTLQPGRMLFVFHEEELRRVLAID